MKSIKHRQFWSVNGIKHWNTEDCFLFGSWLVGIGEYGYGLLVIYATTMGLKVNRLLGRKWYEFIDSETLDCEYTLQLTGTKKEDEQAREISEHVRIITRQVIDALQEAKMISYDDDVFINTNTGKPLTTSTLKRELLNFDVKYRKHIKSITKKDLNLIDISTNTFEIAWARDMITLHKNSKAVFSTVSEYLGHQTIKQTIEYLDLECIDKVFLTFNFFPAMDSTLTFKELLDFNNEEWLSTYMNENGLLI